MREGDSLDEMLRKELLRSELKEKNKGKRIIPCKYRPKYPDSAEKRIYAIGKCIYGYRERGAYEVYARYKSKILNEGTQLRADSKKDNEQKRRTARFSA